MSERPNYGTLRTDDASGRPYITDLATGKRLFKYPPCRICGMTPWWFSADRHDDTCGCCAPSRMERNDNEPSLEDLLS